MKQILTFFKLTLALVLFLQVGEVSGQTSCTVNGVSITATGTNTSTYVSVAGGCVSGAFTGSGAWSGSTGTTGTVVYTFSKPVVQANITYTAVNNNVGGVDVGTITTNGGGTITLTNPCNVTISGNVITASGDPSNAPDAQISVASTVPFTSVTITNTGGKSGWVQGNPCNFTFTPCNAGNAPTLSATTKATTCPSTTVDLTALLTSTTPAGASLVWYTNNAHTGTAIADATQVATAGTYYAFYYDATNSCYSPASTAIAVTITNCCANVAAAGVN